MSASGPRRVSAILLFLSACLFVPVQSAADSPSIERAREMFENGLYDFVHDRFAEARVALEIALPLFRAEDSPFNEMLTLKLLGKTTHGLARLDEARGYFSEALSLARRLGDLLGEDYRRRFGSDSLTIAENLRELGTVERDAGNYETARVRYGEAMTIAQEMRHRWGEGETYRLLGDLERTAGRRSEASQAYDQAIHIFSFIDAQISVADTFVGLADLISATQPQVARAYYRNAAAIFGTYSPKRRDVALLKAQAIP